jgi:hypothetical protein
MKNCNLDYLSININPTFKKRIRTTNYIVNVHFNTTNKENLNDKIFRLIKNDMTNKRNNMTADRLHI